MGLTIKKTISAVLLRVVLYPLIIFAFFPLYFLAIHMFPKRAVSQYSPKQWNIDYQDVTIVTQDGLTLAGWFIPNKKSAKAVIVCHGYPMDKGDVFGVSEFLAKDYNLFYFDFRAMGKSQGRLSTSGWRERKDFLAAVDFLKAKGFQDIGAFGFSMGAAALLMAESPDIKCAVSDSSYARQSTVTSVLVKQFGPLRVPLTQLIRFWAWCFLRVDINSVNPVDSVARMKIPLLFIHCQGDRFIPASEAVALHQAAAGSELLMISAGTHGESSLTQEYEPRIKAFFRKNL